MGGVAKEFNFRTISTVCIMVQDKQTKRQQNKTVSRYLEHFYITRDHESRIALEFIRSSMHILHMSDSHEALTCLAVSLMSP